MNNAILTKENCVQNSYKREYDNRQWKDSAILAATATGNHIPHLLFRCSCAKIVWAVVAHCLGATGIPKSVNQS